MNRLFPLSILAFGLLAAPAFRVAMATTGILKCTSADGIVSYGDHACPGGSKATPMAGDLLARIARDEARQPDAVNAMDTDAIPVSARRSVSGGCARTPTQLAMDLRAAIALADVNRVAESYHWVGLSTREGERILDRLQRLAGKPVTDVHYFDATISDSPFGVDAVQLASAQGAAGPAGMLQLQLGQGAGVSVVDFDVERYAGCYFVRY